MLPLLYYTLGDADGEADGDIDGDTDGDTDGDALGDNDADGDTDGDTDGEADGDKEADGNIVHGPVHLAEKEIVPIPDLSNEIAIVCIRTPALARPPFAVVIFGV